MNSQSGIYNRPCVLPSAHPEVSKHLSDFINISMCVFVILLNSSDLESDVDLVAIGPMLSEKQHKAQKRKHESKHKKSKHKKHKK